ncbi:MAG TPA: PilC/PilY family type IV pilus protein [Frateuria sp.]|uniref:pilus assembly protein n=1 Tax=Frateuria sp. TaxID=2211372 RepID=UPI002DEC3F5D|nr:PilC/PilY family type IV pilus protein [Frateuria sp.]
MTIAKPRVLRPLNTVFVAAVGVFFCGALSLSPAARAATASPLPISQIPLTVAQPVHPQVLFALGNSQSMDGDLSGAIMTGSGAFGSSTGLSSLSSSSSPVDYTVPSGFTPPLNAGSAVPAGSSTVLAPYTVNSSGAEYDTSSGGTQYDNSASRLNVAKAGISAILQQYMPSTDFALMDYSAPSSSTYTTWVYLMSPEGGFKFSASNTNPPLGTRYIANPCYKYSSASSSVRSNCSSIDSLYGGTIGGYPYMLIAASSDDPSINDVLYASGLSGVFDTYNRSGGDPSSPFPPNFTLAQYNSGSISVGYDSSSPNNGGFSTNPTNAGYVPYSTQVIYAERGFGFYSTASATTGTTVVKMTTAGLSPTTSSVNTAVAAFTPSLKPETNSGSSSEIKALTVQSPLAGLLKGAQATLKSSLPTSSNGCAQPKQYVVLITDGLPTQDLANKLWPPLGSASASGYGVTATFNTDGSLKTTNDQALTDTISQLQALNQAGIQTYVIGLGAGVDPSKNPQAAATLAAMAVAGGTASASPDKYFKATSPAALVTDLQAILANVSSQNSSSSSAAANSTSLNANSMVYQATFTPGASTGNAWIGDLDEYSISTGAVISSTPTWSVQAQLDIQGTARNIATWDPYHTDSSGTVAPVGVPFQWSNLSTTLRGQLQPSDSNGQIRVDYLRGSHAKEQTSGGPFRNRAHLLGDVVDSSPAFVGPPSSYFPDGSYQTFVTNNASRTPMLYFGANDGMLHGVSAATGNEQMAFIPNAVFGNLYALTDPLYYYHHQFFVDGSPQVGDALLSDGNWHTLLVGGENAGGKSVYALDVTNPAGFTSDTSVASAVKWEFTDAGMGLSYGTPVIVRSNAVTVTDSSNNAKVNGFAVLFGNGYNSASEQPIFYAVNASDGSVIAKINLCSASGVPASACSSSLPNGLSGVAAANSSGLVGVPADMAYAGDLQGNLWAINISDANPSNWTVKLLFQARDSSGNPQPITSTPSLTPNPNFPTELGLMVYFGTGRFFVTGDLTTTNPQSFYGVWDNSSDLSSYPSGTAPTMPYTRSNLQAQTLSLSTFTSGSTSTPVILSSNNTVNLTYSPITINNPSPPPATLSLSPQEGWYFDLTPLGGGARSYTDSQVESGGVLFTINVPPGGTGSICGLPTSYLMNVAYGTGGPFSRAAIGLNGGASVGPGNTVNGQNPTGVFVSNAYAAAPTTMRTGSGANLQIISTANGLKAVPTIGDKSGRVGWWQIQ